jgi:hypothetical protein
MKKFKNNLINDRERKDLELLLANIEHKFEESANGANTLEEILSTLNQNLSLLAHKEKEIREKMKSLKILV